MGPGVRKAGLGAAGSWFPLAVFAVAVAVAVYAVAALVQPSHAPRLPQSLPSRQRHLLPVLMASS